MKRIFTLITCLLSLQFANASSGLLPAHRILAPAASYKAGDTTILPVVNQPMALTGEYGIYKRRLDSIKKDVPLDFNEYVQSYIEIYARNREEMGRMLGLSKYYFPIYEKAFRDAGIPDELKYLSIVESKLDPNAVSRVGAAGPWQFMFTTAKIYGLNMDDYVDDRRDPIQATYAAAAYLKDAYEEFGDWLLAIASYNCGKSNVEHAIDKAGTSDFWSIRQYLPAETRNYVPAYIAVTYLMQCYAKHNIMPQSCDMVLKTDTVLVNKYVSLGLVAQALNTDIRQLLILNPAYKRQIINGTAQSPRRLVIPQVERGKYAALYNVLNSSTMTVPAPVPMQVVYNENKPEHHQLYHVVKHGETLSDIADAFGVDLEDLKAWNHIEGRKVAAGTRLRLSESADESEKEPSIKHAHNYITYKVKRGDTLSGIASKFEGASVEKIKSLNGLKRGDLQPGMTIKISKG
jgi:membrane-bound lytic murein transglycosylase D